MLRLLEQGEFTLVVPDDEMAVGLQALMDRGRPGWQT